MSLDAPCDPKEENGRGKPHGNTYFVMSVRKWDHDYSFMLCFMSFVNAMPSNVSKEINWRWILFIPSTLKKISPTLKLWVKQDMSSNTLLFLHVISFLDVPPLSFSLHLPQHGWRDQEEIHVPGRVFVSNGSASAAAVAGISITSVVPFLPCMDQLPVSG